MIAIIDYGSGNLRSVAKAFEYVAGARKVEITSDAKALVRADHIVLPGVGAFGDCMRGLSALPGMLEALNDEVRGKKKPFLGICVGMQMMFERGLEHGEHPGLGWLEGEVVPIAAAPGLKIPHMGWNVLSQMRPHAITQGIGEDAHAYFVHSYHAVAHPEDIIATTHYGELIPAIVGRDNMLGMQFHPEKSQDTGLKLLGNFLA